MLFTLNALERNLICIDTELWEGAHLFISYFVNSGGKIVFIFQSYLGLIYTLFLFLPTFIFPTKPFTDSFTTFLQLLFGLTNPLEMYLCVYIYLCICVEQKSS